MAAKALAAAVRNKRERRLSSSAARCIKNATSSITCRTDEHKADVRRKMQNAYAMADYADAKRALDRLHRELMDLNPSAARSLEEGMEETLTVHKLRVPDQLRRTLCCTNVIRIGFLHGRDRLPQRQALARRRSHRALGRLGTPGGQAPVPAKSSAIANSRNSCLLMATAVPKKPLVKGALPRNL